MGVRQGWEMVNCQSIGGGGRETEREREREREREGEKEKMRSMSVCDKANKKHL